MASSVLSSCLRLRLISIFKSLNCMSGCGGARMMSTTTVNGVNSPPWLMLPPAFEGDNVVHNFYDLAENKVVSLNNKRVDYLPEVDSRSKIVGSSHGWLALFNGRNCDLSLSNPLTGRQVKLPPIHNLPIPKPNLEGGFGCVSKVIISCDAEQEDCRAMMIFGPPDRLAVCCPAGQRQWIPIGALRSPPDYSVARPYEDIVYSSTENLFFCLTEFDHSNDLEGWDLTDPDSPRLRWSNHDDLLGSQNYLAWLLGDEGLWSRPLRYLVFSEESNQLFLVTRHLVERMAPDGSEVEDLDDNNMYPYKTVAFDVHKIDREEGGGGKLSYVESGVGGSLNGLAMFVGLNHSFAMSAAEFPQVLKPNSIYFTDDRALTPPDWDNKQIYGGHDIGIYDYETKTISSCYYPCEVKSFKRIKTAPLWFTPSRH